MVVRQICEKKYPLTAIVKTAPYICPDSAKEHCRDFFVTKTDYDEDDFWHSGGDCSAHGGP